MRKQIEITENDLHRLVKESVKIIIAEKHRPKGVSRRIHTRDANGKKVSFDYIPNLPKYNKNLNFNKASKFQRINARQVEDPNGEDIDTVLKDGTIERKGLHLPPGYWDVNNVGGQEHWGIDPKTFAKKYELDPEMDGVYKPKGGPMDASEPLKRNVSFQAPWGGRMDMKKGSRIMRDPSNVKDTYGIGGDEFDSTYKFDECINRCINKSINRVIKENIDMRFKPLSGYRSTRYHEIPIEDRYDSSTPRFLWLDDVPDTNTLRYPGDWEWYREEYAKAVEKRKRILKNYYRNADPYILNSIDELVDRHYNNFDNREDKEKLALLVNAMEQGEQVTIEEFEDCEY